MTTNVHNEEVLKIVNEVLRRFPNYRNRHGVNVNTSHVSGEAYQCRIRFSQSRKAVRVRVSKDPTFPFVNVVCLERTTDIIEHINEIYTTVRSMNYNSVDEFINHIDEYFEWGIKLTASSKKVIIKPDIIPLEGIEPELRKDILYYGMVTNVEFIDGDGKFIRLAVKVKNHTGTYTITICTSNGKAKIFRVGKLLLMNYRQEFRLMKILTAISHVNITKEIQNELEEIYDTLDIEKTTSHEED